jgi:hypothetical protein
MISSAVSAVSNHAGLNRLNPRFFPTIGVTVDFKTERWSFAVE